MSRMESLVSPPQQGFCGISLSQDLAPLVLVVESGETLTSSLEGLCDFLEIGLLRAEEAMPLGSLLAQHRPMAVIAELDGEVQDGCHVLMTVAAFDPNLPVLMVTGEESHLLGAVDAVEELWGLTAVTKAPRLPRAAALVDYLASASRRASVGRLLPV